MIKNKYTRLIAFFLAIVINTSLLNAYVTAAGSGTDFDSVTDLTDLFTDDGTPQFTNSATGGINNSGSVNVPLPSNDLWTTKQSYSVSGNAGNIYEFSAYFKVAANSGYGNLGFTTESSSVPTGIGQPITGLGANFHGGGGAFVNNGVSTNLSWPPDLILGNWYWMSFEVTTKGSNTFDLKLQIVETDSTGVLGATKTEQTQSNVVNTDLGTASTIYAFFSAAGSRMDRVDGFTVDLEGVTFVEEGTPVVLSASAASSIVNTSAEFGGESIDENGSTINTKGVCWSTSSEPTIADNCSTDGGGIGTFSSDITGLAPATTYYARAYATNSVGTSYGAEITFTTTGDPLTPDTDGIDNLIEQAAPNSGDANADNIPDYMQANVASFLNSKTSEYMVLSADSIGSDCSITEISQIDEDSNLSKDVAFSYPLGLIDFTVDCDTTGSTLTIEIIYYDELNLDDEFVLRKLNSSSNTYSAGPEYDLTVGSLADNEVRIVTYQVTDGGEFDADGTTNGTIVDPVGLGIAEVSAPNTGFGGLYKTTLTK